MTEFKIYRANSNKAKELGAIFTKKVGFKVNCKCGTGSMKFHYGLNSGVARGYTFTPEQAEIIRQTLVEVGGADISSEDFTDKAKTMHLNRPWFMLKTAV